MVNAIANLITVSDHKQMKAFIKASRYKSTNNLLIITFFDNKKLSNSKKDIVFGANLLGSYEREDLYHDFFNRKRAQELLLEKILKSPDAFSTIEILDLFCMISLKKERIASFLDQYIGEVRPALVVNK